MKIEALKIEKIPDLLNGLSDKSIKSIVVAKSGEQPLIHLMAVPHTLAPKVIGIMASLEIPLEFVEVVESDFVDTNVE